MKTQIHMYIHRTMTTFSRVQLFVDARVLGTNLVTGQTLPPSITSSSSSTLQSIRIGNRLCWNLRLYFLPFSLRSCFIFVLLSCLPQYPVDTQGPQITKFSRRVGVYDVRTFNQQSVRQRTKEKILAANQIELFLV